MANPYIGTSTFKHQQIGHDFLDWEFNPATRRLKVVENAETVAQAAHRRLMLWRGSMVWNVTHGIPYWQTLRGDNQPADENLFKAIAAREVMKDPRVDRLISPVDITVDRQNRIWSVRIEAELVNGLLLEEQFDVPFPDGLQA